MNWYKIFLTVFGGIAMLSFTQSNSYAFFDDAKFATLPEHTFVNSKHYISDNLYLYTDETQWYVMDIDIVSKDQSRTVFVGKIIDASATSFIGKTLGASLPTPIIKDFSTKEYYKLLPTQKL